MGKNRAIFMKLEAQQAVDDLVSWALSLKEHGSSDPCRRTAASDLPANPINHLNLVVYDRHLSLPFRPKIFIRCQLCHEVGDINAAGLPALKMTLRWGEV